MGDTTAPTKAQTIIIVTGLVLGFILAIGGYITGHDWLAFAGTVLSGGSGVTGLVKGVI